MGLNPASLPAKWRKKIRVTPYPICQQCRQMGLPIPIMEYRFALPRRWRFDFYFPAQKLALEVEGGVWVNGAHNRGKHFLSDMEKYNEACLLGIRVLRVTPSQVASGEAVRMVRRAIQGEQDA